MSFPVPILILAFNRPADTQQVFDRVKAMRPKQLFVAVDGPRSHKDDEAAACEAVQQIFLSQVDWDCKLHTLFRAQNLGCRTAVHGAIEWFFQQVTSGIILEDDCVPDLTFFPFCAELLDLYQDQKQIMHIGGYRPQDIPTTDEYSYHFSKQVIVSGWATWSDRWAKMEVDMPAFPAYEQEKKIASYLPDESAQVYMMEKWRETYHKNNSSWAYAWSFSVARHQGRSVLPRVNLIRHIGYGDSATNTQADQQNRYANVQRAIEFPLVHPPLDNGWSAAKNEKWELAIFHKIQKSKIGLLRRKYIPRTLLNRAKKWLDAFTS